MKKLSARQIETSRETGKKRAHNLTGKERLFVEQYIGPAKRNGTEAALAAYDTKNRGIAGSIASENLTKPKIKAEIAYLLAQRGIELEEIVDLHARNARQSENLGVSQKAIGDFYDILGMKDGPDKQGSVRVAFIIEQ